MVTLRIGLGFVVAGVTQTVNVAGTPALSVAGAVMVICGAPAMLTVTLAEACPVLAGVVGVVVPPPFDGGVVVDDPPCAPTVAVTVACILVVSTVVAPPTPLL